MHINYLVNNVNTTVYRIINNSNSRACGEVLWLWHALLPRQVPVRIKLVTRPWMAKLEKTFLENHNLARPGW